MRVQSVGQENTRKPSSVLKAGAIGAAAAALGGHLAPLTKEEHDFFFNSNAMASIKEKVKNTRSKEIGKIAKDFRQGTLSVSKEAFDTFELHKDKIADEPKKAMELVQNSTERVKEGFKSLVSRVDAVGIAKEHTEMASVKSAAKSSRSLGYFAIAGALVAMSAQIMVNAFKSCMPETKPQKPPQKPQEITMADILLEGLGTNTEVLYLTNKMNKK